ncbi:MAG: radical SAM protein [Edaphobacter sp.]
MHVCLVTAPTATEYISADEWSSDEVLSSAARPQLGILNLAAVLEGLGDCPDIVDVNGAYLQFTRTLGSAAGNADFAEFLASKIAENDADLYGFSSICSTYPLTVRVAESVKKLRPNATILFGGPQASVVDVATLTAFPFVDLVLRGEAEVSLPILIAELANEARLDQVAGLTYRDGLQVRRNENAPVIADLDSLPPPAYHLSRYLEGASIAYLELGRGCPFSCTFCSTNDFFRRNFRLRSPARILQEMRDIAKTYSITHFDLVHDMFTVDKRRVAAFCETMLASGEGFTWSCSARTDCVDEPLLELMARSGCRGIFFGVEAGSRRMQKIIDKHLDPQRAEEIIDITERLGISTIVSLIAGFPEETWEDVRETLRILMHSARCPHSDPQLNILAPLAATPIYSLYKRQLVLEELCSDMSHQGLTQNAADLDLIRNHLEIFPNFYLLPMPHLDRESLLELREFLTITVECYRWLVSAIDQTVVDMLAFYFEWRTHRVLLHPGLVGIDLRRYYVGHDFRSDFLTFVREHPVGKEPMVAPLLAAECALIQSPHLTAHSGRRVLADQPLRWSDVPSNTRFTDVFELQYDLEQITEALKSRTGPPLPQGRCFYAVRESADGTRSLTKISEWFAALIRACNGTRTVDEVVDQLTFDLQEVKDEDKGYVFINLLQQAQSQGIITIYRTNPTDIAPGQENLVESLEMRSHIS